MKMWIARNQDGSLALFRKKKPKLFWDEKVGQYWVGSSMWLHPNDYPEVTFENSPMEVELVLPSQEPTIGDLLNQLIETKKEMRKFREMVSRMRQVQKNYSSYESTFGECAKLDLKRREADVDRWLRETEETEYED